MSCQRSINDVEEEWIQQPTNKRRVTLSPGNEGDDETPRAIDDDTANKRNTTDSPTPTAAANTLHSETPSPRECPELVPPKSDEDEEPRGRRGRSKDDTLGSVTSKGSSSSLSQLITDTKKLVVTDPAKPFICRNCGKFFTPRGINAHEKRCMPVYTEWASPSPDIQQPKPKESENEEQPVSESKDQEHETSSSVEADSDDKEMDEEDDNDLDEFETSVTGSNELDDSSGRNHSGNNSNSNSDSSVTGSASPSMLKETVSETTLNATTDTDSNRVTSTSSFNNPSPRASFSNEVVTMSEAATRTTDNSGVEGQAAGAMSDLDAHELRKLIDTANAPIFGIDAHGDEANDPPPPPTLEKEYSPTFDVKMKKIDQDSEDAYINIGFPLPEAIQPGCKNVNICKMIRNASTDMMELLIQYNALRCPNNCFTTHQMCPVAFCSTIHQVYCLFDKDCNPNHIEKIGCSGNITQRYLPDKLKRCFILVSPRTISPELDVLLLGVVDQLLLDICENKSLPRDFRRLCETILYRGGDRLGLKKPFYFQLIEIACQLKYKTSAPAELFTTGDEMQEKRRSQVKAVVEQFILKDDLVDFIGKPIQMIDTWATGQQKGLLSSQVVANEFVADGWPWEDAMPTPVIENTTCVEEIYSTNWTKEEIQQGRDRIYYWIKDTINNESVLLLAKNQEKLFPKDKLLDILQCNYHFKATFAVNDGRIVSLTHSTARAKIILYSPLGFAMDSRPETISLFPQQVRTFMEMEVLRQVVRVLSNKKTTFGTTSEDKDDSLTSAFFFESIWRFFHQHRFAAAAVARDALTPDGIRACEQNNMRKVLECNAYHICPRGRRMTTAREPTTNRPLEKSKILEAANMLSFATEETLSFDLTRVQDLFLSDGQVTLIAVGVRWKSLLEHHILPGTQLRIQSQDYVDAYLKVNAGNRSGYKPTNLPENDEVVRTLCCDGRHFLIQDKKPATDSLERNFDPSEFPDWAIFKNNFYVHPDYFVYDGLKNRLLPRTKKKNTKAKTAWQPESRKKLRKINKVYCFLDGSQCPIEVHPRASICGPNGSTNFSLCCIVDG